MHQIMATFGQRKPDLDIPGHTTGPASPAEQPKLSSSLWGEGSAKEWGPPEIQADEIEYLEKIGGGCFGSVYRGRCRGKEVAIKKLFRQNVDEKTLADFRKEVQIMSQLRHPNVLLFMGACTTPGKMALVTELMPKGNLHTLLHDPKCELSLYRRLQMARDTALGMNWLHCSSPQIIHRDLKPSNLLLDEHLCVKVCDFGLSAVKNPGDKLQDKGGIPGTPLWMAPEVLMGRPLDEKSDVYSFGIVLWEIVTRKEPFETMDSFKEFKRAICRDHERPELPRGLNPRLAALMTACWDRDPQRRPSFAKVLEELQELLIEIAVRDEVAARLWRTAFLGRDRLPWNEFLLGLARASTSQAPQLGALPSADSLLLRCLKALLAERVAGEVHLDQAEQVSCENWGKIIAWFGPLDTWTTFLERVRQALQQSWFHGAIEKQEAESLLSGQPEGAFLVRLSTSQPGCFTISKVSRSLKIQHQRIDYQAERNLFSIQIQSADGQLREATTTGSLEAFISEHARELNLKSPVPCSRFRFLFERSASEGYLLPVEDY